MMIDVKNRCIITKDGGEQVIVDEVSSIVFEFEFMGLNYTLFKSASDFARDCCFR
jgi:hypothetical protein